MHRNLPNPRRYTKHVGLRTILRLPELEAQIAEGDLHVEDLESIWLEACAIKVVIAFIYF